METSGSVGGRGFSVTTSERTTSKFDAQDSMNHYTEVVERIRMPIGPCPSLRVVARGENRLDDRNDGAVATGVPSFDDKFLVFCDDLAFVRRMTPALTAAPTSHTGGLALGGGEISVERTGGGHARPAASYLNSLIPLLPPELRR